MALEFKELTIDVKEKLEPYFKAREILSCEYNFNVMFLWAKYNQTQYAVTDNYLILSEVIEGKFITLMPLCKEEYFKEAFEDVLAYFQQEGIKFRMYVTDKLFKDFVKKNYGDKYDIIANRDYFDYLYDGEKLRTLVGKKYGKKRNHLNAFYSEYEGRYLYRKLVKEDKSDVCKYLRNWKIHKDEISDSLDEELSAICRIITNLEQLDVKAGGIFVDGKLEAISIGTLTNNGKEAVIHVEKANDEIRGMYPLINQLFLINEFPNVEIVNREEDLGIEGLRKSKLSYEPIKILKKYSIVEKEVDESNGYSCYNQSRR
ncbi:MAG: hypothetical protein CVU84_15960 [Firmicutes bacterium HGW-Firmicutes-1]|jgi:hypothetical protein|nr:MAG: hypothetical protein CVU84_15960 [Firmicutes bacterium HGW-Firmicutes-1]